MNRIYSSDRDVNRAAYWQQVRSDLVLAPIIAGVVFLIALYSVNLAALAVLVDIAHWIFGRISKSGIKMTFPAFSIALTLDILAIYVAAVFF